MKVDLVSVTESRVEGIHSPEQLIVHCARVSNPNNQLDVASGDRLLRYCMKHEHWSIFEQASMCVRIETSRAIAAQLLRHKSFSFQEFSQRYSSVAQFEPVELRQQAEKNRQSSSEVITNSVLHSWVDAVVAASTVAYKELIKLGVARECARMILPLCTQTTMYMSGTVRSWIHYLKLRLKEDTQKEHREVAEKIFQIFAKEFPLTADCIERDQLGDPTNMIQK